MRRHAVNADAEDGGDRRQAQEQIAIITFLRSKSALVTGRHYAGKVTSNDLLF